MLRAVVVAIVVAGSMPNVLGAERSFEIKGTGVSRQDEATCLREISAFEKRLVKHGLILTKKTECETVDGEAEAFAPVFEAQSDRPLLAETAVTIYQSTRESCEKTLKALLAGVADENEIIIDAGCAPLTILDAEDPEMITETFQPTVTLLKSSEDQPLELVSRH